MVSIQNLEFELQDLFRDKKYSEIIFEITTKTQENESFSINIKKIIYGGNCVY